MWRQSCADVLLRTVRYVCYRTGRASNTQASNTSAKYAYIAGLTPGDPAQLRVRAASRIPPRRIVQLSRSTALASTQSRATWQPLRWRYVANPRHGRDHRTYAGSAARRETDLGSTCRLGRQAVARWDLGAGYATGDDGIRTRDLRIANATLSQLSYVPIGRTTL